MDDKSFDLVFFHESLGYGDRSKSLREATRVLDDGGRIYMKDLCIAQDSDPVKVARLSKSWMYRYDRREDIERECMQRGLRKEFSRPFPDNFNEATLAMMTDPDLMKRHILRCQVSPFPSDPGSFATRKPSNSCELINYLLVVWGCLINVENSMPTFPRRMSLLQVASHIRTLA